MTHTEALRLALDALWSGVRSINHLGGAKEAVPLHEAIEACRAALAAPAAGPVAWALTHRDGRVTLHPASEYAVAYRDTCVAETPLYARAAPAAPSVPPDLIEYMRRHLEHQRSLIVGFTKLGNETRRAAKIDGWIAALAAAATDGGQHG